MSDSLRILLVEDNPGDVRLVREFLRAGPGPPEWAIDAVGRLDAALEELARRPADLVVLDLGLPDSEGLGTFRTLHERFPELPVVVLTGLADEDLAGRTVAAGAQDYLVKDMIEGDGLRRTVRYAVERARAERAQHLIYRLREVAARAADMQSLLEGFADEVRRFTRCAAVGIRTLDEQGNIPYAAQIGFSKRFFELESPLSIHRDRCMCINVVRGETDPGRPFYTPGGSFCANCTTKLLAIVSEREKGETRNECNREGYESVALVPIRHRSRIVGLVHVADPRENAVPRDVVEALEDAAPELAAEMERMRAEERTRRHVAQLNSLRAIDMAIITTFDHRVTLGIVLDKMLSDLHADAADVLLVARDAPVLQFAAGAGFRSAALRCTSLPLGHGHAGRAALERRAITVPDVGSDPGAFARAPLLGDEGFVWYMAVPLVCKGQVRGVLEVFRRSAFRPDAEWLEFLDAVAGQTAVAIDNAVLFEDLQRSNVDLALAYDATIEGWSRALDLRDQETEGHSLRVTEMTVRVARGLGFSAADQVHVRRGALLHDIGKVGIPDAVLLKPGPLDADEWVVMKRHPRLAYDLLSPIAHLRPALDIPYCHHEKWDGSGYPRGLAGESIPLAARAFAVVDVWDALRSDRPYRKAWPEEKVRTHVADLGGTHFDPEVLAAFLRIDWSTATLPPYPPPEDGP